MQDSDKEPNANPSLQAGAGAPAPAPAQNPATPPAQEPSPLSFKDMIIQAFRMSINNHNNIVRSAGLLEDATELVSQLRVEIRDLKQQLAAMYLLQDEGLPITSKNVAERMVRAQTEALKSQLDQAEKDGSIKKVDAISKETDIIWYSFPDGGVGYQSVAALEGDLKKDAIGKKSGDQIGEMTVGAVYELVDKSQKTADGQPSTTENQDGQSQAQTAQTQQTQQPQETQQPTA